MIQCLLAIWSLVPLPFLNPACASGSSRFKYYWSLAWRILSITVLACEMSTILQSFEHSFSTSLLWNWDEIDLFQSCVHCLVFQTCWLLSVTLKVSSFRIWNNSARVPSPSLALFIVMLPKAHLTSHSRMSGSRWVTIPLWLSMSLRPFFKVLDYKEFACNVGDPGSISESGRSLEKGMATHSSFLPGEFHGQRSLQATVHVVAKSWTQLSD